MKFKVNTKDLVAALAVAGRVSPTVPKGAPCYLISVTAEGSAWIYSRGDKAVTRAPLTVEEADGSCDFLYPAKVANVFKHVKGTVVFEVDVDTSEGRTRVRYYREDAPDSGVSGERLMENPKNIVKLEAELSEAITTSEYNPALLRVALSTVKNYAAKEGDDVGGMDGEHLYTIQVFDGSKPEWAKGDGVMYAANGYRAAYFECPAFKGKHFPLASEHVPVVSAFLGDCQGTVKLHNTPNMVFFEDSQGRVLGVQHRVKLYPRYGYYSLDKDTFVFQVERMKMVESLRQIEAEIADEGDIRKIRVVYDPDKGHIYFQKVSAIGSARSDEVPVTRAPDDPGDNTSFTAYVNLDNFLDLFNAESHEITLRVAMIAKGSKRFAAFRTLDRVGYTPDGKVAVDTTEEGVVECLTTRFTPSME